MTWADAPVGEAELGRVVGAALGAPRTWPAGPPVIAHGLAVERELRRAGLRMVNVAGRDMDHHGRSLPKSLSLRDQRSVS